MRAWRVAAVLTLFAGVLSAGCSNTPAANCTPACGTSQACCADTSGTHCRSTLVDPQNCGGCGIACATGQTCTLGSCVAGSDSGVRADGGRDAAMSGNCHPSCASGMMCCGATCVSATGIASGDARTDPSFMNCHVCGVACDAMLASRCGLPRGTTTGSPQCLCGDLPSCNTGEMCESVAGTWSCINHATDPRHCGDPAVACMPGELCMDGHCTCTGADGGIGGVCPTGLTCTASGCIDLMTDEMNCGTLANACRAGETCTGGTCGCGTGARCMGGGLGGGCGQTCCNDTCVYVDDYNCGGCGTMCTGAQVCIHNALGGGMPHCGVEGAFVVACDAPVDAAPSDGGPIDAGTDGGTDADVDGGSDAGMDAAVDTGM